MNRATALQVFIFPAISRARWIALDELLPRPGADQIRSIDRADSGFDPALGNRCLA